MVFADTSFWISLRDVREERHAAARELARRLVAEREILIVTPFIFAESHAYFVRSVALRERIIRDFWENPTVRIEPVTQADQARALEMLKSFRDKEYSFCDAVSFAVIRRMRLRRAVAFDGHFRQAGGFETMGM